MSWDGMDKWDRQAILEALIPGAAGEGSADLLLTPGHADTVKEQVERIKAQVERVAHLLAEELREVADWRYEDVLARADEWEAR